MMCNRKKEKVMFEIKEVQDALEISQTDFLLRREVELLQDFDWNRRR